LVVALLRHTDLRPAVDPITGHISRDERSAGANPAELAALETALRVAEAWGGRVLAVTAGSDAAEATLREANAVGASVLRVPWPSRKAADQDAWIASLANDGRWLAQALVAAVRTVGEPDLVLCGDRSSDRGTGAVPAYVAHELGAAQALGLVSLTVDGRELRAQRRLDGGRREVLRVPRPAVCSVEAAGLRLRRASLQAELKARRSAQAGDRAGRSPRVATRSVPTVLGPMPAQEAADVLLHWLAERGYAAVEGT
jgi:electron transfer flavoprotein beta subunit